MCRRNRESYIHTASFNSSVEVIVEWMEETRAKVYYQMNRSARKTQPDEMDRMIRELECMIEVEHQKFINSPRCLLDGIMCIYRAVSTLVFVESS